MNQNNTRDTSYVQDVTFNSGYVVQQRPALLSYVAAAAGFAAPHPTSQYAYLELGCSSGMTLNGLAASNPQAQFYGLDFNEAHIAAAQQAAERAGLDNVHFFQADFRDFADLNLPQFEFITTHGTYSWLDPVTLDAVHAIMDKHLKVGGVVFVDYLALPGKAPIAPMWHLMRKMATSDHPSSAERAKEGFETLRLLAAKNAQFFRRNPDAQQIYKTWDSALQRNPSAANQLAHNALTEHWCPKYSSDLAETLGDLGLTFAGSTSLEMNDSEIALPAALRPAGGLDLSSTQLELIKDFYHFAQLRKDVFIRTADQAQPESVLLNAKMHLAFPWPHGNPEWLFRDPENRPVETDRKIIDQVCTLVTQGKCCIDDIATHLQSDGYGAEAIAKTVKRMMTVPDLEVFSAPPEPAELSGVTGVRAANTYNEAAFEHLARHGGELWLASERVGGCVTVPALVSVAVAAFIGNQINDVTVSRVVDFIRKVPGSYATGQGTMVSGDRVTEQMIAPAHDLVLQVVLPGLIANGALKPL